MTSLHVREDTELAHLVARLKIQFAEQLPDHEIERTVSDAAAELADAPIRVFVPLLIERDARERLRARVAGRHPHA